MVGTTEISFERKKEKEEKVNTATNIMHRPALFEMHSESGYPKHEN